MSPRANGAVAGTALALHAGRVADCAAGAGRVVAHRALQTVIVGAAPQTVSNTGAASSARRPRQVVVQLAEPTVSQVAGQTASVDARASGAHPASSPVVALVALYAGRAVDAGRTARQSAVARQARSPRSQVVPSGASHAVVAVVAQRTADD